MKKRLIVATITLLVALILAVVIRFPHYVYESPYGEQEVTKFVSYDYLPIVKGTINGEEAFFILDSGASISVIDLNYAKTNNMELEDSTELTVSGYGGQNNSMLEIKRVNVEVRGKSLHGEFYADNITNIRSAVYGRTRQNIIGIIGNNNISKEGWILDFRNNIIRK